jgi:hypothetical protein
MAMFKQSLALLLAGLALAAGLLCTAAQAQDAPPTFIGVRNQAGMLLAQSRGGGLPAADYERRLAQIATRAGQLLPTLDTRSQDRHALVETLKGLSPTALGRAEYQAAWNAVLAAQPEFALVVDPQRVAKPASAADEATWTRSLVALLRRTEAHAATLKYDEFQRLTETEFIPVLRKLHLSAIGRLRALPESTRGDDPAFVLLDDGAAGATFVLAYRWLQVPTVRKTKRFVSERLADQKSLGSKENDEWGFSEPYLARLAGDIRDEMAPLIESRIQRALPPSAKPRDQLERQPVPNPEAVPSRERLQLLVYGTPAQIDDARKLLATLVQAGQAIEYATQLDDRVRSTRDAFWRCHVQSCPGYAAVYRSHVQALVEKDVQHLGLNGISQAAVDGGPLLACAESFAALGRRAQADTRLLDRQLAPDVWRGALAELLAAPEYLRYQGCRDIQEIALRPRKSFF